MKTKQVKSSGNPALKLNRIKIAKLSFWHGPQVLTPTTVNTGIASWTCSETTSVVGTSEGTGGGAGLP